MGYALLVVVVFMTGQGQQFASKHTTLEACQVELAGLVPKIAEHNRKASPPAYIAFYAAACTEVKDAPRGTDS